jgi:hypothetical protein
MNQNRNPETSVTTKAELYYKEQFQREESGLRRGLWHLLSVFYSPCRLLLEVFIRKDFGERYFRLSSAVGTFVFFALWPFIWYGLKQYMRIITFGMFSRHDVTPTEGSLFQDYIGWYVYLFVFLAVCFRHHEAQKHAPSVFDFAKYSLYAGRIHDVFVDFKIKGKKGDPRIIECWLEPAPFFAAGLLLAMFGQALGWLLMFSAAVYAASYRDAYNHGDNFVMDMIDNIIISEHHHETFVNGKEMRGYRDRSRKPGDPEKRKRLLDYMMEDDEDAPLAE